MCGVSEQDSGPRLPHQPITNNNPQTIPTTNPQTSNPQQQRLSEVEGVRIYGPAPGADGSQRAALCAFNTASVHASDLAFFLDHEGVAIRSGHHCTQPLHRLLYAKGSARASLYVYNTKADVDALITKLRETMEFFGAFSATSSSAGAGGGGGGGGGGSA